VKNFYRFHCACRNRKVEYKHGISISCTDLINNTLSITGELYFNVSLILLACLSSFYKMWKMQSKSQTEPLLVTQVSLDTIAICNSVQKVFSGKCFKQFWTICYAFKLKCYCSKNTYNLIRRRWHGNLKHDIQYSHYLFLHVNRFTSTIRQAACLLGHIWFNRKHWKWILHCCYSFIRIVDTGSQFWQRYLQGLRMTVHFSGI